MKHDGKTARVWIKSLQQWGRGKTMKEKKGESRMELKHVKFTPEIGEGSEEGFLVTKQAAQIVKENILEKLSEMERGTVLNIGLGSIKYMDAANAGNMLVMVARNIEVGMFPAVFMVLSDMKEQHEQNIHLPFKAANKGVIVLENGGYRIMGGLLVAYKAALSKVMVSGPMTARELQQAMDYRAVNEASTKLSALYKQGLLARKKYKGRAFTYVSLVQNCSA